MEYQIEQRNKMFPLVFQAIRGQSNGAPFFAYYDINEETREGVLELCVPTETEPEKNGVEIKVIPAQKALVTTHVGSYETIFHAYKAVKKYAAENQIELTFPHREVYIKGPGMIFKGNPDKYITEVVFPIKGA